MDSIIKEDTSYVAEKIQPHSDYISGMEFSMDGKYFLTCSVDSSLKLWNGENLLLINYYRHITKLWNVAFGQVGTDGLYAASDHYGVVLIFKLGSKVPDLYLPSIKKMPVRALCFTKNYLITGGDDSLLVYWDKDSINTLLIH